MNLFIIAALINAAAVIAAAIINIKLPNRKRKRKGAGKRILYIKLLKILRRGKKRMRSYFKNSIRIISKLGSQTQKLVSVRTLKLKLTLTLTYKSHI